MNEPSTIDPAEMAHFSALAQKWWDGEGEFRALHLLNPVRLAYIRDHCLRHFGRASGGPAPLAGLDLLDVGCGGGLLTEPLTRLGGRVTGIDPVAETIRIAGVHAREQGLKIDYQVLDTSALVALKKRFNVVLAMEVIEHVADVDAFIAQLAGLVAPGGLLFMATINRTAQSFALAIVAAEYVLNWVPRGTHSWDKFVAPKEIADQLLASGMQVNDQTGVVYSPLADRWKLSPNLDVNYMLVAAQV